MNKINLFKPGLVIYCSKSHDGNMSKKYGNDEIVQENINNFFCDIKIDKKYCQNYHILNSDTICTFDELADYNFNTDAVIITKPNQYVYLAFGDCIPFVVYDNNKNIVGFAHLGWNSICKKLHIKLLQELLKTYQSKKENLMVYFGPSISANSYAFPNPAQKNMVDWKEYIRFENNLYYIDLVGYIINDIKNFGINETRIINNNIDTATNKNYFSHYRSVHQGIPEARFIFGAGLKNK